MDLTPTRVLIVDDEPDIADTLAEILLSHGCTVETAWNGRDACEVATRFDPHIVLMDLSMPVMDGFHAARLIRDQHSHALRRLVALTAEPRESVLTRALACGFDAFEGKPLRYQRLLELVREYR